MWKFLRSEMSVILGLTEDAERTDAEIADIYDMKKGTVSSARRRLLDAGAMFFVYVPAFNRLGCELVACHMGATDPAVRSEEKANHYMEFCGRTPQVFFAIIGGNNIVLYSVFRNATELEMFTQRHNAFFTGARRPFKAKLTSIVFPYSLSRITQVPQFAPLVHSYFELDVPKPKPVPLSSVSVDAVELNESEKRALVAMVKDPEASDKEIASRLRLSRQAITRIRAKLRDEGVLTKVCIPRLYRWGFEIYVAALSRFRTEVSWEKRLKTEPREVLERSFYTLSKSDESVANYTTPRFAEYSEQLESYLAWYHQMKIFEERPELLLFSLERSTELRTFEYLPAVRNLLLADRPADGSQTSANL
ncbi:MAG: helix-turn-helix domain-containing protein [Thermoplasmata archaeon]